MRGATTRRGEDGLTPIDSGGLSIASRDSTAPSLATTNVFSRRLPTRFSKATDRAKRPLLHAAQTRRE